MNFKHQCTHQEVIKIFVLKLFNCANERRRIFHVVLHQFLMKPPTFFSRDNRTIGGLEKKIPRSILFLFPRSFELGSFFFCLIHSPHQYFTIIFPSYMCFKLPLFIMRCFPGLNFVWLFKKFVRAFEK